MYHRSIAKIPKLPLSNLYPAKHRRR